jgi:hypothetical protein
MAVEGTIPSTALIFANRSLPTTSFAAAPLVLADGFLRLLMFGSI